MGEPIEFPLRVVAHGGGVQSTALLVLSAQRKIDFPVHLFCNVGDDSEHPASLKYVREVSIPYANEHGVELLELHRTWKDGREPLTLKQLELHRKGVSIPMRGALTGAPMSRGCTADFKVAVISKWLRAHGATKETPATIGIGFSVDEMERAKQSQDAREIRQFPLLELGLTRQDCLNLIADAGLPEPGKSSCYFCPFHRPQVWAEMRRDEPELFEKAAQFEDDIRAKEIEAGRPAPFLTRLGRPLRECIGPAQDTLPGFGSDIGEDGCDEGVCFV